MLSKRKKLFCFGYGYTAQHLEPLLQKRGFDIAGTTTTRDKVLPHLHLFNREKPIQNAKKVFENVTHILISIPPDAQGDIVLAMHAKDIQTIPNLEWIGYLSTTGVYGDRQGDWVDEDTKPAPATQRSIARLDAETKWRGFDLPAHIFRLSGIYGPGRSAIDTVREGQAQRINKKNHVFNRIHVDDIAQTLAASMTKPKPGAIYNLADDLPAPNEEVIAYARELLNLPPLPLIEYENARLTEMAKEFYSECKRVRNNKIKSELGVKLEYPNYKSGLKAILAD